MVDFNVNGKAVSMAAEPDTPLLWAIREHLKLTGTKFGYKKNNFKPAD